MSNNTSVKIGDHVRMTDPDGRYNGAVEYGDIGVVVRVDRADDNSPAAIEWPVVGLKWTDVSKWEVVADSTDDDGMESVVPRDIRDGEEFTFTVKARRVGSSVRIGCKTFTISEIADVAPLVQRKKSAVPVPQDGEIWEALHTNRVLGTDREKRRYLVMNGEMLWVDGPNLSNGSTAASFAAGIGRGATTYAEQTKVLNADGTRP